MLAQATMIDRMLASDPDYNGVFITAVKTTGIYCLPSCHARKPKPENVEFFTTPDLARQAGYRACKQCRPDDFYNGINPEETLIENVVAAMYADPAQFGEVQAVANAANVGVTKLFELMRIHYHGTPADMLMKARIEAAQHALLNSTSAITTIAHDVGFESLSAFNANFRQLSAMSPTEFRKLTEQHHFRLALPSDYQHERILSQLGRDPRSLTARVDGHVWTSSVRLHEHDGATVQVKFDQTHAECEVVHGLDLDSAAMQTIYRHVMLSLGLTCDPQRFEAHVAKSPELAPLVAGKHGLRIPLVSDVYDGITWAIIGQQINLPFAFTLRQRLIERFGTPLADGLYLAPTAATVAQLHEEDLTPLQFSRSKASYLIGISQAIVDERLPLATFNRASFSKIERMLLAQRGIGAWSAHYVLMRALGFADCVPVGDTGLTSGLQQFFQLEQRPDRATTLALMAAFSPFRSLATFHFWQR